MSLLLLVIHMFITNILWTVESVLMKQRIIELYLKIYYVQLIQFDLMSSFI